MDEQTKRDAYQGLIDALERVFLFYKETPLVLRRLLPAMRNGAIKARDEIDAKAESQEKQGE